MRKYFILFAILALSLAQCSYANMSSKDDDEPKSKECETIAQACKDAGFTRHGEKGKKLWRNCMKPIILGNMVAGVTITKKDAEACKEFKIKQLEKKLDELKSAK